jgi:hypothetical protein
VEEDADAFCREVEAHLCRRNAGHLVRIVGPAFEMVAGWAARGIPLKVAVRGIDACVERRNAKGPSRRPLRIEFCEADVLDAFDQWRRAVGVGTAGGGAAAPGEEADEGSGANRRSRPTHSLRAHLDRVVTRLTSCVAGGALPPGLEAAVESVITGLGDERAASRSLRGDARTQFIEQLREIDARLLAAARAAASGEELAAIRGEAERELATFRDRMAADDFAKAVAVATDKLLRERWRLPDICYDA